MCYYCIKKTIALYNKLKRMEVMVLMEKLLIDPNNS